MSDELISVIIPVYDMEKYLERCIDSVRNSTYSNLEIICVDDGSTDQSLQILNELALQDARIIVLHKENGGLCSARNAGLAVATGEYIAFIDPDDWVHKDYFTLLHRAITEFSADTAVCEFSRTSGEDIFGNRPTYEPRLMSVQEMASTSYIKDVVWRRLYRRSLLENVQFEQSQRYEDTAFNFMLLAKKPDMKIVYFQAVLYAYYYREGSLSMADGLPGRLALAKYQASFLKATCEPALELIACESFKNALYARYDYDILRNKEKVKECNSILGEDVKYIRKNRLACCLVAKSPKLYRVYRLLRDKTAIQYERQIREKYSQN